MASDNRASSGPRVTLYHNPRCGKSRQALALLQDHGVEVEIVEYLKDPPSVARLADLCKGMGLQPLQLFRVKEKRFKELGLGRGDRRPAREWLRILHENPVLIERPIAVCGERVALGRPTENVLSVLPHR